MLVVGTGVLMGSSELARAQAPYIVPNNSKPSVSTLPYVPGRSSSCIGPLCVDSKAGVPYQVRAQMPYPPNTQCMARWGTDSGNPIGHVNLECRVGGAKLFDKHIYPSQVGTVGMIGNAVAGHYSQMELVRRGMNQCNNESLVPCNRPALYSNMNKLNYR